MKTSTNVSYKECVHIQDVAKKIDQVLKIVCCSSRKWPETIIFTIMHLQALLARRPIPGDVMHKLWYVRGVGTIRVMKCIILAFVWSSDSRLEMQLNGP
jgi:hypothetical protein